MVNLEIRHTLDLFFPITLVAMIPADLVIGLTKGAYPTQATVAIWLGALIAWLMWRKLSQPRRPMVVPGGDPEEIAGAYMNRQLNVGLGASMMGLALALVVFGLVMIYFSPTRPLPFSDLSFAKVVELGFLLMFNLMIAGLELFAARIYLLGRR